MGSKAPYICGFYYHKTIFLLAKSWQNGLAPSEYPEAAAQSETILAVAVAGRCMLEGYQVVWVYTESWRHTAAVLSKPHISSNLRIPPKALCATPTW